MIGETLSALLSPHRDKEAINWKDRSYTYDWLLDRIGYWTRQCRNFGISAGTVAAIQGDFSPNTIALFLALMEQHCILVPLAAGAVVQSAEAIRIAGVGVCFSLDADDEVQVVSIQARAVRPYYPELRRRGHSGLVLFSSGSTGPAKAAVHDLETILKKFRVPRSAWRTIPFLLYDHIGGVNTMLYTLCNGGCLVTVQARTPDAVLAAVSRHRVELLPTSPTFINLILLSEAYRRHDLRSLKLVTYGTEPMRQSTLQRFHRLYPGIQLLQTYGLSEVGILRSKSRGSESLWLQVGGEGFATRVVDGMLEIKSESAMLGYLNAPSPFTADGWLPTGDMVEVDGEFIRILGRRSEMINVGGEKVFPCEVESVIGEMENVADATVYPEKNAILGNIVCARICLQRPEARPEFIVRLRRHCRERLARFKIPVRVTLVAAEPHTKRFKKQRNFP